jgi:hypothetical protein
MHQKLFCFLSSQGVSADLLQKVEAKVNAQKGALIYGISTEPRTFKTIKNAMMDGQQLKQLQEAIRLY